MAVSAIFFKFNRQAPVPNGSISRPRDNALLLVRKDAALSRSRTRADALGTRSSKGYKIQCGQSEASIHFVLPFPLIVMMRDGCLGVAIVSRQVMVIKGNDFSDQVYGGGVNWYREQLRDHTQGGIGSSMCIRLCPLAQTASS
jgi:hypothetical protein